MDPVDRQAATPERPYEAVVEQYLVTKLTEMAQAYRHAAARIAGMGTVAEAVDWLKAEAAETQRVADQTAEAAWERTEGDQR